MCGKILKGINRGFNWRFRRLSLYRGMGFGLGGVPQSIRFHVSRALEDEAAAVLSSLPQKGAIF
jgi:hypothetical protein